MLNLAIRCIIIYFFLFFAMRLMGKRQLGELQPFEFAITLVAADLACIPMNDPTIPIIHGIIPVFTLFLVHLIITKLASKSIGFRKVFNGLPVIIIDKGNIQTKKLNDLDMSTNDLLEGLRGAGYFSPEEVECAIIETNGKMSVMPKFCSKPATNEDLGITSGKSILPYTIILEGKFLQKNLDKCETSVTKTQILQILDKHSLQMKNVFCLMLSEDSIFLQPYNAEAIAIDMAQDKVSDRLEKEEKTDIA